MTTIPTDPNQTLYAVIGRDVSRSKSPTVHNAAFEALDAPYRFIAISTDDPLGVYRQALANDYGGLAITMPHKSALISHLDAIDDAAAEIGAINTILFRDGKSFGANTDVIGIHKALAELGIDLHGTNAAVLGAGGAARSAIVALRLCGVEHATVLARSEKRAQMLAEDRRLLHGMSSSFARFDQNEAQQLLLDVDIVVQTTPVGGRDLPMQTPIDPDWLPDGVMLFDVVYAPLPTPLMSAVADRYGKTIGGDRMFLYQAAEQFRLWTGVEAPFAVMEKAFYAEGK